MSTPVFSFATVYLYTLPCCCFFNGLVSLNIGQLSRPIQVNASVYLKKIKNQQILRYMVFTGRLFVHMAQTNFVMLLKS